MARLRTPPLLLVTLLAAAAAAAEAGRGWPGAPTPHSALFALIGRDVAHELPAVLANVEGLAGGLPTYNSLY